MGCCSNYKKQTISSMISVNNDQNRYDQASMSTVMLEVIEPT